MEAIFLKKDYLFLYALLAVVYLTGLFIPLMENDSAQHATMAMRMYLENDFLNIYKGVNDYLDKPHLHFWLAAFAFKIFGLHDWAYRIPSLLFTILAAYSCFKLAQELYNKHAGHVATLIFLSTQAIILANHDVKTDSVLTGAIMFSLWQLIVFINHNQLKNIILGSFGLGLAFSTKGHLGIFIVGMCLITHLVYTKKWNVLWNWKLFAGILAFTITILPVLYAYYVQFDLHPEKIIHGTTNNSGVLFILWNHSFERLNAIHETQSPSYFFFLHTFIWVCIPWALIAYIALISRLQKLWITRFDFSKNREIITSLGALLIVLIISFSKFKLPHYLNGLLPLSAILVAGFLLQLQANKNKKTTTILLYIQYATISILTGICLFLIFGAFSAPSAIAIVLDVILLGGLIWLLKDKMSRIKRLLYISICGMIFINFCLNTQFYPKLLKYQSGNELAKVISAENINSNKIYRLNGRNSWSLDFYTQQITPTITAENVNNNLHSGDWLFFYSEDLDKVKQHDISWTEAYNTNYFPVSELELPFLNPKTREHVLQQSYLVKLK